MPDDHVVSRWVFYPRMTTEEHELIWHTVFEFPKGRPESVVWRKYLPDIQHVHREGCLREACANKRNEERGKDLIRYEGAISAQVGRIRSIRSSNSFGFAVAHDPSDGQPIYHAHIAYAADADRPLTKQDKIELKTLLRAVFSDLSAHSCKS